jgi:hypothetical protein
MKLKQVVPASTAAPVFDSEHLELAFGGFCDAFDSDDIDTLRHSGTLWLPEFRS